MIVLFHPWVLSNSEGALSNTPSLTFMSHTPIAATAFKIVSPLGNYTEQVFYDWRAAASTGSPSGSAGLVSIQVATCRLRGSTPPQIDPQVSSPLGCQVLAAALISIPISLWWQCLSTPAQIPMNESATLSQYLAAVSRSSATTGLLLITTWAPSNPWSESIAVDWRSSD
jgi:hypothetical protein